jgi:YggT family protein
MIAIANVIRIFSNVYVIIIIAKVVVSYFLSPYHSIRLVLDKLVDPPLHLIQRFVPPLGMIDFSPMVLIILIQLVAYLLEAFLILL